ncbi:hypothetical protein LEP1GSC161_0339 [Leptospira santarosai str. CBC1416]|uniref:Uncharacterized protein n=1 Tax=Leptospira santarosai str. CBC1416 TaxID=1193059 RepID=M6VXM3_9LEPT|nr:hypothetical protein LEP1GSC161_0339 [Leptospira santarosai str. CBC1416]
MFVESFKRIPMTEETGGDPGRGEGGGASGVSDELVDLSINGTVHKVPKAVSQIFGNLNRDLRTANSDLKVLKETVASSNGPEVQELREKLQELEFQKLPAKEQETAKLNAELSKLRSSHDSETKKSLRYETLFRENAITAALNTALSGYKLYGGPTKALQLLSLNGQPKVLEESDGKFRVVLNMDLDGNGVLEYDPIEAVKKYLALPENANLLENSLQPGAGTPSGGKAGPGGVRVFTPAEWQNEFSKAKDTAERKEMMRKAKSGEYIVKSA